MCDAIQLLYLFHFWNILESFFQLSFFVDNFSSIFPITCYDNFCKVKYTVYQHNHMQTSIWLCMYGI